MKEESPSRGANQPGDGDAPAVRRQPIAALPAAHRVCMPAAIELGASFAEPKQRRIARCKRNGTGGLVDRQCLKRLSIERLNEKAEGFEMRANAIRRGLESVSLRRFSPVLARQEAAGGNTLHSGGQHAETHG